MARPITEWRVRRAAGIRADLCRKPWGVLAGR